MKEKRSLWDRPTAIIGVTGGIVFGLAAFVYAFFPAISSYLWCFYVGYFMTVVTGQDPKNFGKYIVCFLCGYFWAWCFWYGQDLFVMLGVTNWPAARALGDFTVTLIMLYVHLHLLRNTVANTPPLMFAAVATIFGNHGYWEHLPRAGASIFCGMAMALLCGMVNTAWIGAKKTKGLQQ